VDNEVLAKRLSELEREFARGQEQMAALDQQRVELHDTLLRISGAISVLRELQQRLDAARSGAANTALRGEPSR
jgi:hypothetical protein